MAAEPEHEIPIHIIPDNPADEPLPDWAMKLPIGEFLKAYSKQIRRGLGYPLARMTEFRERNKRRHPQHQ